MYAGLSRNDDPGTSHDAADSVTTKIPNLNKLVLDCLEEEKRGPGKGMTSKEIAADLGLDHVTISPRMKPLEKLGMVRRTIRRRKKSIVWEVV